MEGVSEAQIQSVLTMLTAVLSPNNEVRKQQEVLLMQLRNEHPNELVLCLLHILRHSPDSSIRTLSSVILRQLFTSLHSSTKVWDKLSSQVQNIVKTHLLESLEQETSWPILKKIGEVIAELAVLLFADEETNKWTELLPFLTRSFTGQGKQAAAACHILAGLCTFFNDELVKEKDSLKQVFIAHLASNELELRLSVLNFLGNLLGIAEKDDMKFFWDIIPNMLLSAFWIIENHQIHAEEALNHLRDLAETEPKYFKNRIQIAYEFVDRVCNLQTENLGIKHLALEFIVALAGRLNLEFQEKKDIATNLCTKIFQMMLSIDEDVDPAWACPPEGFEEPDDEDEEGVEIDYAKLGRKQLTKMLEGVGESFLLPTVLGLIQSALTTPSEDWRVKYAALMTISELGQFIEEAEKIAEIVPVLQAHTSPNLHPKIRYAAYHCIGQLSEDYEEEFQSAHHQAVVPLLVAGIADSIPRVAASAADALGKFIENCGPTLVSEYIAGIMPVIIEKFSQQNCSIVIEQILTVISNIADSGKECFNPYYQPLMVVLLRIIKAYTSKEYQRIRGKAIESMTMICTSVGKEMFSPYVTETIMLLKEIQDSVTDSDPLKAYLLGAWQRIVATLQADFAPYLHGILPGLLSAAGASAIVSVESEPDALVDLASLVSDANKKVSISTSDLEDKDLALHALITIIDVLKELYAPYAEQTNTIVLPLINYTPNEHIRQAAATLCGSLINSVKALNTPESDQAVINMARLYLGALWQATAVEHDTETIVAQLAAIKVIIEGPKNKFMTPEEVTASGEKLIKMLETSLDRRARNKALDLGEEDSEDELIKEINKNEEDSLHTQISEVLGSLFKTHREFSLEIVNFLYSHVLSKFLAPDTTDEDHKFAIFVIDDVVEFVGQDLAGDKWSSLAEALVRFTADSNDAVRQAASYGIGILAIFSNAAAFAPWTDQILVALDKSINFPMGTNKKSHGHAKDNAVAALGKIIKYQSGSINSATIVPAWVNLLPLRRDKEEAKLMHDLLADITISNMALTIGENNERLEHVVKIFAEILETKLINTETVPKVKQIIQMIQAAGIPTLPQIWATLTDIQRSKLTKIMA
ncbi:unnamed protein product [Blepharisma stoltei]|uniref:TOG domain-containing protein n=1 Tax=Blepharisma stoltei TaxID=1481888 RepID=A0AAU9IR66_9CILI|nr:unnamed protein product [Blepharisma stoltei]